MDFVTVSTGLILPYWMGLPIRYIQDVAYNIVSKYKTEIRFDDLYEQIAHNFDFDSD